MFNQALDPQFTQVRRSTKAITDENWIKAFLSEAPVGLLATVCQDQPFLSAKLFAYDPVRNAIYLHSADKGRVMENILQNPKVCFTAYRMGRLLPAENARSFGLEYESVVVFGLLRIAAERAEVIAALEQIMQKYAPQFEPGQDYPAIQEKDLGGLAVYRLEIDAWSAKADLGAEDHPGAYFYEDIARTMS